MEKRRKENDMQHIFSLTHADLSMIMDTDTHMQHLYHKPNTEDWRINVNKAIGETHMHSSRVLVAAECSHSLKYMSTRKYTQQKKK